MKMPSRRSRVKRIVREHADYSDRQLLNWAMNQLFRAARLIDMAEIGATITKDHYVGIGCDATATCILNRLIKTNGGYDLVRKTNKKLLRGYKKP